MTKSQIKWASQHDWYVKSIGGTVVVNDVYYNHHLKRNTSQIKCFDAFNRLKEWAGY